MTDPCEVNRRDLVAAQREVQELRELVEEAAKWVDEAAWDLEDERGILLARKLRGRLTSPDGGE